MTIAPLGDRFDDQARALVARVCGVIQDEHDQTPTLAELCTSLVWGIKACPDDILLDTNPLSLIDLEPVVAKHRRPRRKAEPIDDLHSDCFDETTDLVVALCGEIEAVAGRKPSVVELAALLALGVRSCPAGTLADVDPAQVTGLKPVVEKHPKVVLKPGDVLAVPSTKGGDHLILYVGDSRHGAAFGLFEGRSAGGPLPNGWQPRPILPPWFTGLEMVVSREWPVAGSRPDLLTLFPAKFEYYHDGYPFGTAEDGEGNSRPVSREESDAIGLHDGRYQACPNEYVMAEHLDKLNPLPAAAHSPGDP